MDYVGGWGGCMRAGGGGGVCCMIMVQSTPVKNMFQKR